MDWLAAYLVVDEAEAKEVDTVVKMIRYREESEHYTWCERARHFLTPGNLVPTAYLTPFALDTTLVDV